MARFCVKTASSPPSSARSSLFGTCPASPSASTSKSERAPRICFACLRWRMARHTIRLEIAAPRAATARLQGKKSPLLS
eukprot:1452038-Pleurochrysis_carterae.AAC.1